MITIKGIIDEDFVNYKKPSMYIAFPKCDFKCDKECGRAVCQNSALAKSPNIETVAKKLVQRYLHNPMTEAVVFGGLEPFDTPKDLFFLVSLFRSYTEDDIVIYTGYTEEEMEEMVKKLKNFTNIIVKFGRFIPDQKSHYDEVLGVKLASPNQYAIKIS